MNSACSVSMFDWFYESGSGSVYQFALLLVHFAVFHRVSAFPAEILFILVYEEVKNMPISDAYNKTDRLQQVQLCFWRSKDRRLRTSDIADLLGVSVDTAARYLTELSSDGRLPLARDKWYWYLPKEAKFEVLPVTFTLEEAVSLYLAGRLLTQAQDERNQHMLSALTKVVAVMPETIAPHQHALIDMLRERQRVQPDISGVFGTLALGWATHRVVRLRYTPPRRRTFECLFSPYLLEPSAIGRTIYALGHSTVPEGLRTYKLERIELAELMGDVFTLPPDFDGPALLKRAWGVMYGDETLVEVRLRFSHYVTQRVKETLWHPSQEMQDTSEGCVWTAQIGDTLEIENWIRGWGSNCEVLAPQDLREKIIQDARRTARMYGITAKEQSAPDVLDENLFNDFFGG